MLEHHSLLVVHQAFPGPRAILDAVTGQSLGYACWRMATGRWRWLCGRALEVHETEDDPLLFTVRRPWSWPARFEVRDAEGCVVGALSGRFLMNEFNRRIATSRRVNDRQAFLENARGETLAVLHFGPDGVQIDFRPAVEPDPFVKMLLLATALV